MGDESLGRESNINFIYMRELPLVGMDSVSVGSVFCSTWSPAVTSPQDTASLSHLETKGRNTILLYKPSESGHQKDEIQGAGHRLASSSSLCVPSAQPGGVVLFTAA